MLENVNPVIYEVTRNRRPLNKDELVDDCERDLIDQGEIFDHIRDINDPEHPLSLEQLHVVEETGVTVDDPGSHVGIRFTPTIPHCSMATLIGLSIKVKLLRSLPPRFKIDVAITPGTHNSEAAINKQLADKERVAAAMENPALSDMVNKCLSATRGDF